VLGVEGIFRDITERKRAEESLKKSEELFSNVAQNSPLPLAIIDPDGTYHFINKSFIETFGYDLDDFRMGREWFLLAFPDPEYRKEVISAWQSDFEHSSVGEPRPRTYTVRCKNGADKIISFRPVTLSDGKQCIIYEDITEHIEARRVRELLSSIVESTDDAIIGKDNNGTIISWNQAARRLYGYLSEEIIGHHISQIIPPERREEMEEILKKIRNGEVVDKLETLRVRKDGKVIGVDVTISPIRNADGAVMGASTIARDISSRKAEERLKDTEEKYRSLVDTITAGVYRSTGDPAGKFTWGNSSLVSILGYPSLDKLREIEIAGIFVEPDGRKKLLEELSREGFVKNKEVELRRADGTIIRVSVTALTNFNTTGDLVYINGIVEDITDQTKAKHQLDVMHKEIIDIIEFLPDATFVVDSEKRVIAWNAAMERLTGIKKAEIIGQGGYAHALPFYGKSRPLLLDLLDSPDEEILQYYSGARREGSALINEGLVRSLYGGKGAFLWAKAFPLKDLAGNRIGSIETIRELPEPAVLPGVMIGEHGPSDATAGSMQDQPAGTRAVAQGAVQAPGYASLLYLSNALKMANDGITLLDLSARFIWANDALVTLLDVQNSDAIVGRSVAQYVASEMRKPTLDRLSNVRKHGHDAFPLFLLTPAGRVPVEASISVVADEAGELLGYMAILRGVKNAAQPGSVKTGGASQSRPGKKESKV
jgi:PAS domain S-box-containing protein